jgi:hypothetical protein
LSGFPVLTIVLDASSHCAQGADFTVVLLRALLAGMYAFVAFCVTLAVPLAGTGSGLAGLAHAVAATFGAPWATRRATGGGR